MPVTLRDVAARAGVTPVVVSRVLHNKAQGVRVSEATAERVRKVADDLGYRLNVWARNFRAQETKTIGILHGVGFARPILKSGSRYFAALMDGFIDGAFRHGYSLTLCPKLLGNRPEEGISDGRFDGLVWYSTSNSAENYETLMACNVPVVVIHAHTDQFNCRFPTVMCDNFQGLGLAVDHLYDLGHRSIAFVYDNHIFSAEVVERMQAFSKHMARRALPVTDGDFLANEADAEPLNRYLAEGPRHTAVIAYNEGLAAEIVRAAPSHGIVVPDRLSVVGFDSTSFCDEIRPTLTAVRQPLQAMGELAIDLLVRTIGGEHCDPLEIILPCGFDARSSTTSIAKEVNPI